MEPQASKAEEAAERDAADLRNGGNADAEHTPNEATAEAARAEWHKERMMARIDPVERMFLKFVDMGDEPDALQKWKDEVASLPPALEQRLNERLLEWHMA